MNGLGRGENNENKEKRSVITKETAGMTLLLFSAVAFLICITRSLMFGEVGIAITGFLLGCFGYLTYPLLLLVMYLSSVMVFGKKFLSGKWIGLCSMLVCTVFLIVHLATSLDYAGGTYGEYLAGCFLAGEGGISTSTGGGIIYALVVFPFRKLLSVAGAFVIFSFLVALALFFILRETPLFDYLRRKAVGAKREVRAPKTVIREETGRERGNVRAYPVPVAFDEIEAPVRPAVPPRDVQQPAVTPAADPVRKEEPVPSDPYRLSRDILFSTDPASSYKNNLIYDRDSGFNNRVRRSSVEANPVAQPEPVAPATPATDVSYLTDYSAQAEEPRPAMPRRVIEPQPIEERDFRRTDPVTEVPVAPVEQPPVFRRTEEYTVPEEPTQFPSYKADIPEQAPVRDFRRNDVPFEEEFSSAPHIDDIPDEPVSGQFGRTEEPVAPAETEEPSIDRGANFRRLFSAPSESLRTPVEPVLPEEKEGEDFLLRGRLREDPLPEEEPEEESRVLRSRINERESIADLFDDEDPEPEEPIREEPALPERGRRFEMAAPVPANPVPGEAPVPKKHVYKPYVQPSVELFRQTEDTVTVSQEEIERNSATIVETLAGFRVDAEIVKVTCGSSVTRYDVDIPRNISVNTVIRRSEEIAMRLHARDGVNMYANRERGAISIEVPNSKRALVGVRSVMQAEDYINAKPNALSFVIGKDVEGRNICGNIVKMKHLLVAGATGSGKSVCLNAMLISLICKYSPEQLRLILIDPKKVEFAVYDGLPHLMINEIITDAQKAVTALNWAIKEMERRYALFEQMTRGGKLVRELDEYNANLTEDDEKLPKIVVVVDELADLMSVAKKDIEDRIQRLTAKARAAGIHLVIATQRPSVDVITGVIKGNLPTRLAFRVIQEVDSRTILDESGAEKLLGNGDLLYRTEGMFDCSRVQGAYLGSEEVQAVVESIKTNNEAYFDDSVADYINNTSQTAASEVGGGDDGDSAVDPQYIKALGIVVNLGSASISLIQRKCSVGYNHAGKIIEWMEVMGYISPFDGKAKARTVLLSKEEYESKYGSLD